MSTLLMRLCAPIQSWRVESRMVLRHTSDIPSKSGVVGILACALGIDRNAADNAQQIAPLARLKMGVRVLRAGSVLSDYQTARDVRRFAGGTQTAIIQRHYLQDADFLVALEGEDVRLLQACHAALKAPRWPLVLGSRNSIPALPLWLPDDPVYGGPGIRQQSLRDALLSWPWRADETTALCVYDDPNGDEEAMDYPLSFHPTAPRYAPRRYQRIIESRPQEAHA